MFIQTLTRPPVNRLGRPRDIPILIGARLPLQNMFSIAAPGQKLEIGVQTWRDRWLGSSVPSQNAKGNPWMEGKETSDSGFINPLWVSNMRVGSFPSHVPIGSDRVNHWLRGPTVSSRTNTPPFGVGGGLLSSYSGHALRQGSGTGFRRCRPPRACR